jgi:hypothetical protein
LYNNHQNRKAQARRLEAKNTPFHAGSKTSVIESASLGKMVPRDILSSICTRKQNVCMFIMWGNSNHHILNYIFPAGSSNHRFSTLESVSIFSGLSEIHGSSLGVT